MPPRQPITPHVGIRFYRMVEQEADRSTVELAGSASRNPAYVPGRTTGAYGGGVPKRGPPYAPGRTTEADGGRVPQSGPAVLLRKAWKPCYSMMVSCDA